MINMPWESEEKRVREEFAQVFLTESNLTAEENAMLNLWHARKAYAEAERDHERAQEALDRASARLQSASGSLQAAEQRMHDQLEEARKQRGFTKDATIKETTFTGSSQ